MKQQVLSRYGVMLALGLVFVPAAYGQRTDSVSLTGEQGAPPKAGVVLRGRNHTEAGAVQSGASREELERRFREAGERLVREKLSLTDDQMTKLREANQRLDLRRRNLFRQFFDNRKALQEEIERGENSSAQRLEQLMEEGTRLMERQFEMMRDEQKELSAFMTPLQRAQYQSLQAQMRMRVLSFGDQPGPPGRRPPEGGRPRNEPPR